MLPQPAGGSDWNFEVYADRGQRVKQSHSHFTLKMEAAWSFKLVSYHITTQ
jgi:hypothetical protein